jgi:hypothetical protein
MNSLTYDNGYLVLTLQTTYITHIKKFPILQGTEKLLSTRNWKKRHLQSLEAQQQKGLFSSPAPHPPFFWGLP